MACPNAAFETPTVSASVVFVGYGVTAPEHDYDDYSGIDVEGKIVMVLRYVPGQALETWQCKSVPPKRSDCVTNPMPQVAGLHALLPLALCLAPLAFGVLALRLQLRRSRLRAVGGAGLLRPLSRFFLFFSLFSFFFVGRKQQSEELGHTIW